MDKLVKRILSFIIIIIILFFIFRKIKINNNIESMVNLPFKVVNIIFQTNTSNLKSVMFHKLSKEGPYFDAHFGKLNSKTPIGQTYYIRPRTIYKAPNNYHGGQITFMLDNCNNSVHFNNNKVSNKFKINGKVVIQPFEWINGKAKEFTNQQISVNIQLTNKTGLPLKGFHIHDGQFKNGLSGFGPITYFLYSSRDWNNLYNKSKKSQIFAKKYLPLPLENVIPRNRHFLLNTISSH